MNLLLHGLDAPRIDPGNSLLVGTDTQLLWQSRSLALAVDVSYQVTITVAIFTSICKDVDTWNSTDSFGGMNCYCRPKLRTKRASPIRDCGVRICRLYEGPR